MLGGIVTEGVLRFGPVPVVVDANHIGVAHGLVDSMLRGNAVEAPRSGVNLDDGSHLGVIQSNFALRSLIGQRHL